MITYPKEKSTPLVAWAALALAAAGLVLPFVKPSAPLAGSPGKSNAPAESSLTRIKRTRVLRVGWGGFPPYTKLKPNESDPNRRVEGFMVDLISEMAARSEPPLKLEWHLLQWDTFRADLQSSKFDFIADPVYQTVGRALDFRASDPVSYFGIAVGLVRKDEQRFTKFADIDQPDVTIALAEGYTSSEYARAHLARAKFKSIPVGTDAFAQLDDVLLGKSDIALNDVPTVLQYARAHADKVKALWIANPPAIVAGGFLAGKEDMDLVDYLNCSLRVLRADGTVKKLDEKWQTLGMFPTEQFEPGAGLRPTP